MKKCDVKTAAIERETCIACKNVHPELGKAQIELRKIWQIPLCLAPVSKTMKAIWE